MPRVAIRRTAVSVTMQPVITGDTVVGGTLSCTGGSSAADTYQWAVNGEDVENEEASTFDTTGLTASDEITCHGLADDNAYATTKFVLSVDPDVGAPTPNGLLAYIGVLANNFDGPFDTITSPINHVLSAGSGHCTSNSSSTRDFAWYVNGESADNTTWYFDPVAEGCEVGDRIRLTATFTLAGNTSQTRYSNEVTLIAEEAIETSLQAPTTFNTDYSLPTGGTTYTPADSAELTTALAACSLGDVIVLAAGTTYTSNFLLSDKGEGEGWIYIISDELASLPEGQRVTLDDVSHMPTLTVATNAPIHSAWGAHHWRLCGLRVVVSTARTSTMMFGYNSNFTTQFTSYGDSPHNIVVDRCVVGSTNDATILTHGIILAGEYMAVVDTYIYNCKNTADAQAIEVSNGKGPYKIVNNFLEGTGENFMAGGTDPWVPYCVPSDIEFRRNHVYKPLAWEVANDWGVKNSFELKNAQRVECSENLFENNWIDAQVGFMIVCTVRNQSWGAPWSVVQDFNFEDNILRTSGSAFNYTGEDDLVPSLQSKRLRIHNILVENLTRDYSAQPILFSVGTPNRPILGLELSNVTNVPDPSSEGLYHFLVIDTDAVDGLTVVDNISEHGSYTPTWANAANITRSGNVLYMNSGNSRYAFNVSNFASHYPSGFQMADPDIAAVGFVDSDNGDYRLDSGSDFKGDGTGGADPGIDQDVLDVIDANALSGDWS